MTVPGQKHRTPRAAPRQFGQPLLDAQGKARGMALAARQVGVFTDAKMGGLRDKNLRRVGGAQRALLLLLEGVAGAAEEICKASHAAALRDGNVDAYVRYAHRTIGEFARGLVECAEAEYARIRDDLAEDMRPTARSAVRVLRRMVTTVAEDLDTLLKILSPVSEENRA